MIKTLIIEDEEPAARRLAKLLTACNKEIEILEILDSIESSVEWLRNNKEPDLVMLDIQLSDGQSFDIFKKIKLNAFVIFTTAYDEFALKAFELNSVDYLLKPVKPELLQKSINKFLNLKTNHAEQTMHIEDVIEMISSKKKVYKKRFVINIGNRIKIIETEAVAYFYSLEKNTFLCNRETKIYPVDFSLDNLEKLLDPESFFRVNRQFIIGFKSIQNIHILSMSRIKLDVSPKADMEILVSSAKSALFKKWLDK